jgi:hypothetical protein
MPRARELAARSAFAVALAWMVVCAPDVSAQRSALRIAVGEVGASDGDRAAARALSRELALAIEQQPDADLAPRRRAELVLRGSVVRMTSERVAGGLEVRCEVSVIVTDGGGSIRAMLRGRGGARGGGDPAQLSSDALRAAVRGALRPLATQGARLASAG